MKNNTLFVSAVIVAAGRGIRMGTEINKQYIEIYGKQVLARTIQAFEDYEGVDEIILSVNGQDIIYCKQDIVERYGFKKVKTLVAGGSSRQESVYNGLKEVSRSCGIVLVHDGARPFLDERCIRDSIETAREHGAACLAVPVKDTVKTGDDEGFIKKTLERHTLWSIQTPQTFGYELAMEAHTKAIQDGFEGTDDSVLAERLGVRVKLVMGSYNNIKITTREDIAMAEAIAAVCPLTTYTTVTQLKT